MIGHNPGIRPSFPRPLATLCLTVTALLLNPSSVSSEPTSTTALSSARGALIDPQGLTSDDSIITVPLQYTDDPADFVRFNWFGGSQPALVMKQQPDEAIESLPGFRYSTQLYGTLLLGDGEDNVYTFVLDIDVGNLEGEADVYFDKNNNESLTDDGGPIAHDSSWSIDIHEIQVEYTTSAIRPYALTLSYWQDFENSDLVRFDAWSSDSCSREGTVMLEEQRCRVAVFDFALNGLFNDFTGVNPISS